MKKPAQKNREIQIKVVERPKKSGYELRGDNRVMFSAPEHKVVIAGPADCAKTFSCCLKIHAINLRCPGAQGAIMRKTSKSLRGSILMTFNRIIKNQGVKIIGGETPTRYQYPNGSTIWLGGLDDPTNALSSERDYIYVNQLEQCTLNDWEIIATRCSGRGSVIAVPQMFADCNPGGSKHWIREQAKAGRLRLLNATHKDNPTLYNRDGTLIDSEDVRRRMKVLDDLTGVRRLRLRDGIWATAEGAVYEMFNAMITGQKSDHVQVRQRSEMQRFYLALDDGFTNPAVILDIGSDADGRWHVFREFFKRGWVHDDVASEAKKWNLENRADLAAVDAAAAGLVEALNRKGVTAYAGKGKIFDGIAKIQSRLKVQLDGRPRLTVDPSCTELINEFESYVWKPEKDVPVDEFNHGLGALRYLADVLNEPTGAFDSASDLMAAESVGIPTPEVVQIEELTFDENPLE